MAPPDQETLAALRESLLPFAEAAVLSAAQRAFCAFYSIDFEDRLPGVSHCMGRVESGQYDLAVHRWKVEGATRNLLLVHGYTDHVGMFGHLIEYGLLNACNVIAFDLPGHGLSSGEAVAIDDFSDYSQAVFNVIAAAAPSNLPCWAMAQSTGCSAIIDYAGRYPWVFSAAVFLAPLIRPVGWNKVRAGHVLLHRFRDRVTRKFNDNSGDKAFLEFMQSDPLQSRHISLKWVGALRDWLSRLKFVDLGVERLLVVQGDADGTVAWRYNMEHIVELFPKCQVELLPGAGHQLANETEPIRRLYLQKVGRFIGL